MVFVERGVEGDLPRSAEIFLLAEPGELVLFDLARLTDRLIWRRAVVTRLRILDQEEARYSERVVADAQGRVERVERRYAPAARSARRVLLTTRRAIARTWMQAASRRGAWVDIRRRLAWSRLDHLTLAGGCFGEGDAEQERRFVSRLVADWKRPDQSLDGLVQPAEGVWGLAGLRLPGDAIVVGPVWIGRGGIEPGSCLVGPAWTPDAGAAGGGAAAARARIRALEEIELLETPRTRGRVAGWNRGYAFAKRAFDIAVSLTALTAGAPIFAAVALWVLLAEGRPVFYGHVRQTRGGRPFRCWKFRTMCRDAEKLRDAYADQDICDGPQVFIRHDPRITRVGHVLRRFQIDEAPQFLNVLLGQMSVVGPRPSPEDENQYCPAWRELRLSVRPGITGLWQLHRTRAPGRDFQEWIRYDIEYVRRAGFGLDLAICFRTAWALLAGRRASCS